MNAHSRAVAIAAMALVVVLALERFAPGGAVVSMLLATGGLVAIVLATGEMPAANGHVRLALVAGVAGVATLGSGALADAFGVVDLRATGVRVALALGAAGAGVLMARWRARR